MQQHLWTYLPDSGAKPVTVAANSFDLTSATSKLLARHGPGTLTRRVAAAPARRPPVLHL